MSAADVEYILVRPRGPVTPLESAVVHRLTTINGVQCSGVVELDPVPVTGPLHRFDRFLNRPVAAAPSLPVISAQQAATRTVDFVLDLAGGSTPFRTRHGVWSLRCGRSSAAAASYEFIRGLDHVHIELLCGDQVIEQAVVNVDPFSFSNTRALVHTAASVLPARAAKRLLCRSPLAHSPAAAGNAHPFHLLELARLAWAVATSIVRGQLNGILYTEMWGVGVIQSPVSALLDTPPSSLPLRWLAEPGKHRFWADPFLARQEGVSLWMEEYDYARSQGYIVSLPLDGSQAEVILDAGVHMSYPFPVWHEGTLYCVPESQRSREAALYKRDAGGWKKAQMLLSDFAALDSTILFHENRWWLFCTSQDDMPECNLYIFYSAVLFGPWLPHALNPVKTDVRSSRPAGTPFVHRGRLYRPAQDSSKGYGSALTINCVRRLTSTEFAEEPVAHLLPVEPYPDGLHTLAALDGELTVIDGKKMAFLPALSWKRLRHKLRIAGKVFFR